LNPKKHKTTAVQLTAELNARLSSPVSTKTAHRELQKVNIYGPAAIAKPLVTCANAKWTVVNLKDELFSDESTFTFTSRVTA